MKANIANALKASGISKPEPPVIKSEPFVPVKVKTEPVELPVVACAGGASASSGQAPLLPSSNNAVGGGSAFGSGGTQDEAGILTHHFVPLADTAEQPGQQQQKDLFLAADLVIPGIALKKMKQALTAANEASKHFFGVMAPATGKMYRKEKPSAQKLVVANMQLHGQVFWQRVVKHFAGNELSVFLVPSNSEMHPTAATWLAKLSSSTAHEHTNIGLAQSDQYSRTPGPAVEADDYKCFRSTLTKNTNKTPTALLSLLRH